MGSVSKQFTAAAIALLVEQGRISLDDDVRKYVPELTTTASEITIDHLVHHTSGIRDWWALVEPRGCGPTTATRWTTCSRSRRDSGISTSIPGAEYNYSNTGYILLGMVVKRVTRKNAASVCGRADLLAARDDELALPRRSQRAGSRTRVRLQPAARRRAGRSTCGTTISSGKAA